MHISGTDVRALPHWSIAAEPDRFYAFVADAKATYGSGLSFPGHMTLQATQLASFRFQCGLNLTWAWPLERPTRDLWRLLETELAAPGLAAAAEATGFSHKHDASAIVGEAAHTLRSRPAKVQHRFMKNETLYAEFLRVRRVAKLALERA